MSEQKKAWQVWEETYRPYRVRKNVAGLLREAFNNLGGNRSVKDLIDEAVKKLGE